MLKTASKPVPVNRKRRKVEVLGTLGQYKQAHEEVKQEEPEPVSALADPSGEATSHVNMSKRQRRPNTQL